MKVDNLAEDIIRAFILSQSLEPLAEKKGCTTRFVDSSLGTKLKYFTISAVNSTWPILTLVNKLLENKEENINIFEYAYYAQEKSTRNRYGGKVNYAQILMLLPIINAQCLMFLEGSDYSNIDKLLDKATIYLKDTNESDVEYLSKFVNLSMQQSTEHNIRIGKKRKQLSPNFDGFSNIIDATEAIDFTQTMMAREMRNGYEHCKRIYYDLLTEDETDLIEQSEKIYPKYLKEFIRHDITADCLVVGFYLVLISNPSKKLFT